MIKLAHVYKNFGKTEVLKDINLEVREGEKLVIIGPSGSGKSTTVRCMNFLEERTSLCEWNTADTQEQDRDSAVIFGNGIPEIQPLSAHGCASQPDPCAHASSQDTEERSNRYCIPFS